MSAEARSTFSSAYISQHALDDVRRRISSGLALIITVIPALLVGFRIASGDSASVDFASLLSTALEVLAGISALLFVRSGNYRIAGVVISLAVLFDYWVSPEQDIRTLLALIATTTSAILTGQRFFLLTIAVITAGQSLNAYNLVSADGGAVTERTINTVISSVLVLLTAIFFRYFNNLAQSTAGRASIANQRLDAVASIGRQTVRLLDYQELVTTTVNLIKSQFGFYHVQIFLVDERREYANLVASTGEAGRRLLERQHRLAVGSESVIGKVTLSNEPVLVNDTENDPGHAFNPLLPDTRAELALPMQVLIDGQTRVIGALDVQSVEPMAFTPADVQALQALANQVAVTIRNARLFEEQAASLRENEQLYSEAQKNLQEIQRLNSQLTHQAWASYLTTHAALRGVTATEAGLTEDYAWSDAMIQAGHNKFPVLLTRDDDLMVVAAPILLRGEVLGVIEVEVERGQDVDMLSTLTAISERMAAALENMRLVEEAQEASVQEQRISAMVSRFQEAATIDELLQITLTELSETLDAEAGSIRVGLTQGAQPAP
jgi:GAF domain-containing protein